MFYLLTVLKVQIVATGCDDAPARGNCRNAFASIKVNGLERSRSRRGLNVVVYNMGTGRYEGAASFDTFASGAAVKQLVSYIDRIKPNRLVMIASSDTYNRRMTSRAYSALVSTHREPSFIVFILRQFI